MESDPIIEALAEQVACYTRLAKLAIVQHQHIQNSKTEELLSVLSSRQEALDQLTELEKTISPAKRKWAEYIAGISPATRAKAESLLAETKALLEKITTADRNDVMVLQQRKLNLGRRIQQTTVAKQVNRNYAVSAYGTAPPRMDLQT
jgi:DNA primase